MEDLFKSHLRDKKLLDSEKQYLLAVSGGLDSVCLGHLLYGCGMKFSVAHVNFGLREDDSQMDEDFVRALAASWGVGIFVTHTDRQSLDATGLSTQMAAREFRYAWFQSLLDTQGIDALLVAHHADDQIETIFLNLVRGTGIEGIYGMADVRGNIIRPMLPFSKAQILEYMLRKGNSWREDRSNSQNDYKRNSLRNEVLPVFEASLPGSLSQIVGSFRRLKDTGKAFFALYEEWRKYHVNVEGDFQYLAIQDILHHPGRLSMLYYWIRDFGFGVHDAEEILASMDQGEPGKIFLGGEYVLNRDRDYLIVGHSGFDFREMDISAHDISCKAQGAAYDILKLSGPVEIDTSPVNAMLDAGKLHFPLKMRKWEQGDKFVPLGMDREKKVSDLLVDLKVPLIQKKRVLVLVSEGKIVWVVGLRISEHFKVDPQTKEVLYFKKTAS